MQTTNHQAAVAPQLHPNKLANADCIARAQASSMLALRPRRSEGYFSHCTPGNDFSLATTERLASASKADISCSK